MLNPSFSLAGAGLLGAAFLGAYAIIKIQSGRIDALQLNLASERAITAQLNEQAVGNAAELGAANARLELSQSLAAERMERQQSDVLAAQSRTQSLEGGINDLRVALEGLQCATGTVVSNGLRVNQSDRNAALKSRQTRNRSVLDSRLLGGSRPDEAGTAGAEPS